MGVAGEGDGGGGRVMRPPQETEFTRQNLGGKMYILSEKKSFSALNIFQVIKPQKSKFNK
jgi:hypothetical protein